MEWKDIAKVVGQSAPILGTLVGGPAGMAIGTMIASGLGVKAEPEAVSAEISANPNAAVLLRQIETTRQIDLQSLVVQAESNRLATDTAVIATVNATMQAEAKAEHWPTYSWRPYCGFVFGTMFLGVYFVLPLFQIPVPTVPSEAWLAMGGILGVASWFRGKAQADPNVATVNRG